MTQNRSTAGCARAQTKKADLSAGLPDASTSKRRDAILCKAGIARCGGEVKSGPAPTPKALVLEV